MKKGKNRITIGITIVSGYAFQKGTILGRISSSGKYMEWDPSALTGIETARMILAENVDSSAGEVKAAAWIHGSFDYSEIRWTDAKHDTSDRRAAIYDLMDRGIFIHGYPVGLHEEVTTTTTSSSTTTTTTQP